MHLHVGDTLLVVIPVVVMYENKENKKHRACRDMLRFRGSGTQRDTHAALPFSTQLISADFSLVASKFT